MSVHPLARGLLELPRASGAYRWLYADATCGDVTAVVIFMLGSPFSARYSAGLRRGAQPLEHCAVNFALYAGGERRAWVLTERAGAHVEDGHTLRIGASSWRYRSDGAIEVHVDELTARGQQRVRAELHLRPRSPTHGPIQLVPGEPHLWQPVAPRAEASLSVPTHDVAAASAHGYHDANFGGERLGLGVPRWRWTRVHDAQATTVLYEPRGAAPLWVRATEDGIELARPADRGAEAAGQPHRPQRPPDATLGEREGAGRWTRWALRIPTELGLAGAQPARLLESSPFYARLEARGGEAHALCEVADFARFHHPAVRWMASWRTRYAPRRRPLPALPTPRSAGLGAGALSLAATEAPRLERGLETLERAEGTR